MRFPVWTSDPLKHAYRALCLVALLIAGQQGAVVHELGHLTGAQCANVHVGPSEIDGSCALCPLFAQVAAAAFSHSFQIPFLPRFGIERVSEPAVRIIDGTGPTPRSRGPPSLS
jgi:hypothetical protein